MSETKFRAYGVSDKDLLAEFDNLDKARDWSNRKVKSECAQVQIDEWVDGEWKLLELHNAIVPNHRPKG